MARVAINGLGRIGRAALKVILETPELELVAVNDIASLDNMAYLIKYDTVYGPYERKVETANGKLVIDGREIAYLSERNPENLPWGNLKVDLVYESTGLFTKQEDASKHIKAGAKFVVISGPTKSEGVPTVVHGVNTSRGETAVISCASCTTNDITPIMEIMNRRVGIKKAIMTTIHAYTASQSLVDAPSGKDGRRGRTAAQNTIPHTTGAAIATTKALPELAGRFDGDALRVPVAVGSIAAVIFVANRPTSVDEINDIFRQEAATQRYQGVVIANEDEIVSSDVIHNPAASIVDLTLTQVVDGDLVKVMSWYDNEWGYTNQMVKQSLEVLGLRELVIG